MDFEFTEQQKMFKEAVQDLNERELKPLLAQCPPDEPLSREVVFGILKMFQPLGVLGAGIPAEAGGSGLDKISLGILAEILLPPVSVGPLEGMQAHIARIYYGATEAVKQRIMAPALAGEKILANATVEPQGGSDTRSIETKAVLVGDHYVINGAKMWINQAGAADALIVTALLGRDEKGRPLLTRFLVEKDVSPYQVRPLKVTGSYWGLCEVVFQDCRVPEQNLIGEGGDALRILTGTWLGLRATLGLAGVYLAQKALDASIAFAKQRKQFGKGMATFQLVQGMIVEMSTLVETSRLLSYKALSLLDNGVWAAKECSMAKYWGTEAAVRVTSLAMKVHGACGLSQELPLQQLWRDAMMLIPPDGTTEINQLIVGREVLGVRAFA